MNSPCCCVIKELLFTPLAHQGLTGSIPWSICQNPHNISHRISSSYPLCWWPLDPFFQILCVLIPPLAQTWLPISYRNKLCSVTMDIAYPVRKTQKTTVHCEKNENAPVPIQWPHPHWHQSSNFSYLRKHDHMGEDYTLEYCSHIEQYLSFSSSVITVLKDRSDRILLTQTFYRSS